MAIAFDAVTTKINNTHQLAAATTSFTITVGSGSNRVLILSIGYWNNGGTAAGASGVTYNGVAMTKVGSTALNGAFASEQWQLVNPALGTNSVVITQSGVTDSIKATASSWTGVDQTTPIDTSNTATGTAGTVSASLTLATANEYLIDVVMHASANTASSGTGTSMLNDATTGVCVASQYKQQSSSGSQSLSWTFPDPGDGWAYSTLALQPSTTLDQHQDSTGANFGFGQVAGVKYRGQCFTPAVAGSLAKLGFNRNKGSKGIRVYIDSATSHKPTHNEAGALYTFDISNANIVNGYAVYTLPTPPALTTGTEYCFYLAPWDVGGTNAYADDYQDCHGVNSGSVEITNTGSWSNENLTFNYATYMVASGSVTTTKTQSALSRITAVTVKTMSGLARVTAKTVRTVSAVSRVTASTARLQTACARLTVSTLKTISGVGRITAQTVRNQTGITRMTAITVKTITGISRVTTSTLKLISGVSRITSNTFKMIAGVSRVTALTVKTQTSLSRMSKSVTKTIASIARITISTSKTLASVTRITVKTLRAQNALSRITQVVNKAQTALSRLSVMNLKTLLVLARVTAFTLKTQSVVSRITAISLKSQPAISRLGRIVGQTSAAVSRITISNLKNLASLTRVMATAIHGQLAATRITRVVVKIQLGVSRMQQNVLKTVSAFSRVTVFALRILPATARVTTTSIKMSFGISRISTVVNRSLSGMSRMSVMNLRNLVTVANILVRRVAMMIAMSRITQLNQKTIPATCHLKSAPGLYRHTTQDFIFIGNLYKKLGGDPYN